MAWLASLQLDYRLDPHADALRTLGRGTHRGPLRVLQSLYPEGPEVCHHVIVHPPGGIVGGDVLQVEARLASRTHAVLTTPGATRFYRSRGELASQDVQCHVATDARLEWLPLETLVHDATRAENHLRLTMAPGSEMLGWELLCHGLPAAGAPFTQGRYDASIELATGEAARPVWLERSRFDLDDPTQAPRTRRLLASPLGHHGQPVLGTMWWGTGTPMPPSRQADLLEAARETCPEDGATAPNDHVVVVRGLAERVEPLMRRFIALRARWRALAWSLGSTTPRVWRT